MTRGAAALYIGALVLMGAGWGITQPLSKIAVSTGHQPLGLVFWQLAIGAAALSAVSLWQRRSLPLSGPAIRVYLVIALIGTLIPNGASYRAVAHLPSGVMSILISLVPMMAFPIALALGLESFSRRRLLGLALGLAGVLLLVLPEASLPERAMLAWIPLALVAPLCYAVEGNYVARWGTAGLDPVRVLWGASLLGAALALPLALATGEFVSPLGGFGAPEAALTVSSLLHVGIYACYVWLVGAAGPVFAAQVSYLVTGFGVIWAMLILAERYSPWIWLAMALVLAGVLLVQPRRKDTIAGDGAIGDTAPEGASAPANGA